MPAHLLGAHRSGLTRARAGRPAPAPAAPSRCHTRQPALGWGLRRRLRRRQAGRAGWSEHQIQHIGEGGLACERAAFRSLRPASCTAATPPRSASAAPLPHNCRLPHLGVQRGAQPRGHRFHRPRTLVGQRPSAALQHALRRALHKQHAAAGARPAGAQRAHHLAIPAGRQGKQGGVGLSVGETQREAQQETGSTCTCAANNHTQHPAARRCLHLHAPQTHTARCPPLPPPACPLHKTTQPAAQCQCRPRNPTC